jgi:hypothetical protein
MCVVGSHSGARPIGLALLAGLVAFEAVLALSAGAVGIPGVLLMRLTDESAARATPVQADGGESVVAKLAAPAATLAEKVPEPAQSAGEPRLEGLADIPLQKWIDDAPARPKPKAFGAEPSGEGSKTRDTLPWDAVEPVPFAPIAPKAAALADATASIQTAPKVQQASGALAELPASGVVAAWVKAKAVKIKGEDRARPLYHFEFWIEPPDDIRKQLAAVAYEFSTPAVRPQSQMSSEKMTGFRVSAGGLACADKITVTLRFMDGRSQQVDVDGCRLLS